jgi:peroxiredoxin
VIAGTGLFFRAGPAWVTLIPFVEEYVPVTFSTIAQGGITLMIRKAGFVLVAALAMVRGGAYAAEVEVGASAPDFKAKGIDGKEYSLKNLKDAKVSIVVFTCNQCPVAIGYEDRLIDFVKKYKDKGVQLIAINANGANSSENIASMKQRSEEKGFNFPYVFDESGDSVRAYGARVTPHIFVIKEGKIAYRGSFDDNQEKPTKKFLADAIDALLAGKKPETASTKAFGCGIRPKEKK